MTTPPSPAAEMLELDAKASEGPWVEDLTLANDNPAVRVHNEKFAICQFTEVRLKWRDDRTFIARSRTLGPLLAQQVVELTAALEAMWQFTAIRGGSGDLLICNWCGRVGPETASAVDIDHKPHCPFAALAGKPQT
jgi:hypothetical protein